MTSRPSAERSCGRNSTLSPMRWRTFCRPICPTGAFTLGNSGKKQYRYGQQRQPGELCQYRYWNGNIITAIDINDRSIDICRYRYFCSHWDRIISISIPLIISISKSMMSQYVMEPFSSSTAIYQYQRHWNSEIYSDRLHLHHQHSGKIIYLIYMLHCHRVYCHIVFNTTVKECY